MPISMPISDAIVRTAQIADHVDMGMAFEIELIECLCCDAGGIARIDHSEGPVGDREHIAHMSGRLDEVERQQKVCVEVSGAKAEDIYTVELVEHDLCEPQAADRAGVIEPVCAIAAQEYRVLHAVGSDRGGEILSVPDALLLLIIGIPHGRKHEEDAVRSLEGLGKEGHVAHVADGGLSAELD